MGVKKWNFDLKTLPYPSLVNHAPPQTDGTEDLILALGGDEESQWIPEV